MQPRAARSLCLTLLLTAAPSSAEQQPIPTSCQAISALACVEHKGLTFTLTEEVREARIVVMRWYGGSGPEFDQGADRLLYEEVVGEAAGEFLRFGKAQPMAVFDANADGHANLVVATLVPVPGAERKLKLFSLNPDQREFTGALFFKQSEDGEAKAFLSHPFSTTVTVGRTIQIGWRDSRMKEYKRSDPYTYVLIQQDP